MSGDSIKGGGSAPGQRLSVVGRTAPLTRERAQPVRRVQRGVLPVETPSHV